MELWGNLAALAGSILMVSIGFIKKKKHILIAQSFQLGFLSLGHWALGATAGLISSVLSIFRNLLFYKVPATPLLKTLFILVQTGLMLLFGISAPIELLPLIATAIFVWAMSAKKDVHFKAVILITQVFWAVYDFYYRNYVAFTFDILTMITTAWGIYLILKWEKEIQE